MNNVVETVRIPGKSSILSPTAPETRLPAASVQLRTRLLGELRGLLVRRGALEGDMAQLQARLDDLNFTINATADTIAKIDRDSLPARLIEEAMAAEQSGQHQG